jgi:hypothetical protein
MTLSSRTKREEFETDLHFILSVYEFSYLHFSKLLHGMASEHWSNFYANIFLGSNVGCHDRFFTVSTAY